MAGNRTPPPEASGNTPDSGSVPGIASVEITESWIQSGGRVQARRTRALARLIQSGGSSQAVRRAIRGESPTDLQSSARFNAIR